MKKTFTLFAFVFAALFSNAQITIDSTDLGSIGDSLVYVSDTIISGINVAPATGAFQTFNYLGLGVTDIGGIEFLDPASTPAAANFPNSNLVVSASGSGMIFTIKSDSAITIDGLFGDLLNQGFDSPIDFSPNVSLMKFPMDYGDAFIEIGVVDTVIDTVVSIFDSIRLRRSMQITSVVDAYGELELPTLSDTVLRKYDIETTVDSIWGHSSFGGGWQAVTQIVETKYYYRFLGKGKDFYLLEAEADAAGVVLRAQYQSGDVLLAGILNHKNISCNGLTDGEAKVTVVSGVPPFTYLWDDMAASTTVDITGLSAGMYNVTVTDATNATSTDQVEIIDPDTISITEDLVIGDDGTGNGSIDISVAGGTPGFSYSWSNGSSIQNLNSLDWGIYTVTVTDVMGCSNSESFIVENLTSVRDINGSEVISVYPNPTSGVLTIETNKAWELKIFSIIGAQVDAARGTGNDKLNISNHPAGVYILEITIDGQVYTSKLQLQK